LQQALDREPSVEVICPARIVGVELGEEHAAAVVAGDDGADLELSCELLVAADGARSSVREMMGIGATQDAYGQRAVIGNLLTERPIENRAFERFTNQGPLAMLPINEGRTAFVWTVAEHDADRVMALDDESFLAELQQAFGNRLGRLSKVGQRVSYPLVLSKAARLTAKRSVLIGNSAHGLHPVSAQGFNLGMRDVAALCDCLADHRRDPDMLQRYADWRHSDQVKLVRFTDSLVKLFGSNRRPLRTLRNVGMLGFDLIPGVRSLFAKHTMGLAGRLPRLSRGVPLK
ncbi:MAG: FAD-dependent monooxygenase, partial [Gammaproteobacteria bacterium]|nr:FAD-dependent monooxygenase [Gammaproteobacteria bacterium]